jgi:hypothetical protein
MSIFEKLKNSALFELIKDQRLSEVITRREVRLSEEYFHREFVSKAVDEEIQELALKFCNGYGEISGKVKKRLLPFSVPFSARFTVQRVDFTPREKQIYLAVEQVKPFDLEWVTSRVVGKIPFLSYGDGIITCNLAKVQRLERFFTYEVKGVKVCDYLTIKELLLKDGEMVGRLGIII